MEKNDKIDFSNTNQNKVSRFRGWNLFSAIFWAFFFAMALGNVLSPYFSSILSGLLNGIAPLLIGISIAFIFSRFIDFVEKVPLKNAFKNSPYKFGLKRTISITAFLVVLFGIFALVFAILVPKIIEIIQRLTVNGGDGSTELINKIVDEICMIIQKWFGADVSQESIKNILNSIFETFMSTVGYLNNLMELSMSFLSGLFNFLIGVLLSIFILKDKEKISRFFRRFTYANFKREKADELCVMTNNAGNILYNYVICKVIEFLILFFTLGITYMIMGLEFTWELSLIVGLFNFIPYFGIYIGGFVAVIITLIFSSSINAALYLAIATVVLTTVEFNTIVPFITGKKLKINALMVIGSILIGGAMFGIVGMLFAPPIMALISVVVMGNIELKENHMKYVMELNKAREQSLQEEKERLNVEQKLSVADEEKNKKVKTTKKSIDISKAENAKKKTSTTKKITTNKKGK